MICTLHDPHFGKEITDRFDTKVIVTHVCNVKRVLEISKNKYSITWIIASKPSSSFIKGWKDMIAKETNGVGREMRNSV
jgi:hypothetical protein